MKKIFSLSALLLFLLTGSGAFVEENKTCDGETFDGKIRAAVKTSIGSEAAYETTIIDLLESLPGTTELDDDSPRSAEEQKNVTITGWLYTYARETDEDFHLILGTSPNSSGRKFISAEISGLPKDKESKDYKRLKKARDQFKSTILNNEDYCSSFTKKLLKKPIHVTITGSLFYDSHHGSGGSGTTDKKTGIEYKSKTPWEIHPVTDIHLAEEN